ncbi:uncharacterized protein LOC116289162 [Actinia tenebrosa]|uniref:Autophagy-related protein 27 n=1 Tax=Actinia tenebrosa TaxID=6105 RepID=A0A6P8HH59_ACTTE|nr:uncharacterized protein LOC116289162 [Actinia tenebrosa]
MAFFFQLMTIFLLFPVIHSQVCEPIDYEISTLTSAQFWWFEIDPSYCSTSKVLSDPNNSAKGLQANVSSTSCMIIFSVCKELPILCPDQGACKIKGINSSFQYISWPVSLGSMDYEGFKFVTGNKFLSFEYHDGDKMSCKTSKGEQQPLKTLITLNCKDDAKWNATAKKEMPFAGGAKAPTGSISFNKQECMYKLSFNSSEGCPHHRGTKGHTLSTGSILLILFFPSVFLYCVIGGLINAGRKKSGTDLIPNYNFWKDLPYLVLDGFGFAISIITCKKATTTSIHRPNSYETM